jgi:hypothetical protein
VSGTLSYRTRGKGVREERVSGTLSYDLAGDIASYVTPLGVTITHAITAAQRVSGITSSLNTSTNPPTLVQNMTYTAWGALSGEKGVRNV